jgi:hypothetical protein
MVSLRLYSLFLIIFIISCDSVQTRFYPKYCYRLHSTENVYKLDHKEGLKVYLKDIKNNEIKTIGAMDRGWNMIDCPET